MDEKRIFKSVKDKKLICIFLLQDEEDKTKLKIFGFIY